MDYPKTKEKKIHKLSKILAKYTQSENIEFCFAQEPIESMEVFSYFGFLPLFLIEAKETYEKMYNNLYTVEDLMQPFGYQTKELNLPQIMEEQTYLESRSIDKKFPIDFHEFEESFFGFIPKLDPNVPSDFFTIAHFTQYTVEEYVKFFKQKQVLLIEGRVPLDKLVESYENKVNARKVEIISQPIGLVLDNNNQVNLTKTNTNELNSNNNNLLES